VAKAPADGYTLLWGTTSSHGGGPNVHRKLPHDPVKDFEPVILAVLAQSVLTVHPSVPVKSVKELIALAKARPAQLNYASSGNGTMSHLAGELFKHLTATRLVHIPYKGSTPALADLPTIAEAGVPGYEVTTWLAIFAPAKTPRDVIVKLNADVNEILRLPDVVKLMSDQGATAGGGPPERLGKHVQTEIARWGKVVKAAGIGVD
jgi:tripartite-type tricarboxylate transporter receptor subunit TctC